MLLKSSLVVLLISAWCCCIGDNFWNYFCFALCYACYGDSGIVWVNFWNNLGYCFCGIICLFVDKFVEIIFAILGYISGIFVISWYYFS
jgi:hypothetical protein